MENIKKTGHADIDTLLLQAHRLLQESTQLQKEIDDALQYKPDTNPK